MTLVVSCWRNLVLERLQLDFSTVAITKMIFKSLHFFLYLFIATDSFNETRYQLGCFHIRFDSLTLNLSCCIYIILSSSKHGFSLQLAGHNIASSFQQVKLRPLRRQAEPNGHECRGTNKKNFKEIRERYPLPLILEKKTFSVGQFNCSE